MPSTRPTPAAYRHIAAQTDAVLRNDVLNKWFPAAVDPRGGFSENFNDDWTPGNNNDRRSLVYQSRLTWMAAEAAAYAPHDKDRYTTIARHGLSFLASKQWDARHGGFFWSVDLIGRPTDDRPNEKHAYGNAFAIYAAATHYHITHDEAALDLAQRAFKWLDTHAHDPTHGGYFESLSTDGTPLPPTTPGSDAIGTRVGRKSMNTHIHLLEALAALHTVWPDPTVRARLQEVFEIVRDRVYTDPGYLTMFFEPDWRRIDGRDSFGHDIETAFLLTEAAGVLGTPDDPRTWTVARRLVDHALDVGFDPAHGGFYDEGTPAGRELHTDKVWWTQAEGLNALLLMHERFGRETPKYWDAFVQQWTFIRDHQIDRDHGGWYPKVTADGTARRPSIKSDPWTECYHQGRALVRVTEMLRRLAD